MVAQFTIQERVFMVRVFSETHDVREVKRQFRRHFPNARAPANRTIRRNYNKYIRYGKSGNRCKDVSGRPRTGRSPQNIQRVQQELQNHPTVSVRRNNAPVTKSTFNRIVRKDLNYIPYRLKLRHALQPGDARRRLAFCNWLQQQPGNFLLHVIVGDEAVFRMNGHVNVWNTRMYAPKNNHPNFTYDVPNNRESVMVWVGLCGDNLIVGPYFFQQNVNAQSYLQMINQYVLPQLQARYGQFANGAVRRLWWVQDGAPAHRAIVVRRRLQQLFPNRVVGLGHPVEWPPRSPDLTPMDFFLWGYIKDKVYKTVPQNIAQLQQRITNCIVGLRRTRMGRRAVHAMATRAQKCIAVQGAQFE